MNLLLFIVGVGVVQAFVLAAFIYVHPKSDRSINRYLALYIICICIPLLIPIAQQFLSWQFLILLEPFLLMIGPFLLLYIKSFTETTSWQKAWPHFIMFILFCIYDVFLFDWFITHYPYGSQVPAEVPRSMVAMIRVPARLLQMALYFFLARRALANYQDSIQQMFSETSRISLSWVRWLNNGYLLLLIVGIVFYAFILKFPDKFELILAINTALVTPYIYGATFKGVSQPALWQIQEGLDKEEVQQELIQVEEVLHHDENSQKTLKNQIGTDKLTEIASQAIAKMEVDKLYLQSELTLKDLADQINIPPYQLTLAINEGLKKSFYDLVNGYRVDEAKRLLLDPKSENVKILAVGLDAGFNSKTTFNTVFKKFTGHTPSDFKDKHRPIT